MDAALARSGFVGGGPAVGGIATLGGKLASRMSREAIDRFRFAAFVSATLDKMTLPDGYDASILVRRGGPLFFCEPEFDQAARGTSESFARSFVDKVGSMEFFTIEGRNLIVVNKEIPNKPVKWGNRQNGKLPNADDLTKGNGAHGITATEIEEAKGVWSVVKYSPFNRRITPNLPFAITGPVRERVLTKTAADPGGNLDDRNMELLRRRPCAMGHIPVVRREFRRVLFGFRRGK